MRIIFIIIATMFLFSCSGNAYIQNEKTIYGAIDFSKNNFFICGDFKTSKYYTNIIANEKCASVGKTYKLVDTSYFSNCSLVKPVSFNYICVDKGAA